MSHQLVLAASFWLHDLWHPLKGSGYQFWSGVGSDIGEIAILGGLLGIARHHNCHVKGCWRLARHPVKGTPYRCCAKHHPAVPSRGASETDVRLAHTRSHRNP